MSKKGKKQLVANIPEIYSNVTRDPSRQHCCIVEDVNGQFFRFNKREENHIVTDAIQKLWPSFNAFCDENKQTLLAYHQNLFKAEPPKDQDLTTTAVYVWFGLCDKATDRTGKTPTEAGGRKSQLLTRKYFLTTIKLVQGQEAALIKTPQAIASYRIVRDAIDQAYARDVEGMPEELRASHVASVTEQDLKQLVTNRAGELKTKQDPWRIFQYYRPTLIKLGVLKHD